MTEVGNLDQWVVGEPFLNLHCVLGEGPYFEKTSNSLRFVDIRKKQLHIVSLDNGKDYETIQLDESISVTADIEGVDPTQRILVGLKYGLAILDRSRGTYEYIQFFEHLKNDRVRSNDGAVDPAGQFWLGTMTDFGMEPFRAEGTKKDGSYIPIHATYMPCIK